MVESEAAYWAARIDATPQIQDASLDTWLNEHPAHAGALLRAQAVLHLMTRNAPDPITPDVAPPDEASPVNAPNKRWRWTLASAGLALAATLAAVLLIDPDAHSYTTEVGELRHVTLADGSALTLDSVSRIKVDLDPHLRDVKFSSGRALFRVAHDPARPFRVVAGAITITDIGTVFELSSTAEGVSVMVSEGEVEITAPSGLMRLRAGQRASFVQGRVVAPQQLSVTDMERELAWSSGRFELDGDTLASAISEMNRHNQRQIQLADPSLGREKLYGAFRFDDPDGFARAAALGLGARAHGDGESIVISAK
jgi:transmembrane sensor